MPADAPQLDLPKGGGAVHGLGESFAPDPHTGTGNLAVPLELPAGRNGLQPRLTLTYSTGSGNGRFGLGWSLSLPEVHRRTSSGVPRYGDDDVFVLTGAQDLVAVPGAPPGRQRYRPEVEAAFQRIERVTDGGQDYWEVWGKDGLRSRYGSVRPAGVDPHTWRDPAAVCDPEDAARIFAWRLSETVDPLGNRISYRWRRDPDAAAQGYEELDLADVRYLDVGDRDDPRYLVHVVLVNDDTPRPDIVSDRRAGFEIRTTGRCVAIQTFMHTGEQPVLARTVRLGYTTSRGNALSLLERLQVVGHDGDATQAMAPLQFGYSAFEPERRRLQSLTAPAGALPDRSLDDADTALLDLTGHGLPGVLRLDGVARYWRNEGDGRLQQPRTLRELPDGLRLSDPGVQLADVDGDGRAELLVTDGSRAGYYRLDAGREAGDGSGPAWVAYRNAPSVSLEDPEVRLVDLDGDAVVDALRTGEDLELWYSDPENGWSPPQRRPRDAAGVPNVSFGDERIRLADMSGDHLTDLVLVANRQVVYWPYRGHGRWDRPVQMANPPAFPDTAGTSGYDPRRLLLGDVDGDGCADLVYVGDGEITVWLNQSGRRFADPVTVRGTPDRVGAAAVQLVDMLGTGTDGLLWTYDAGTRRDSAWRFLDLTGGSKPYLLTSVDNHMGAHTTVQYAPSTRHELAARRAGRPWRTALPFPVQVVDRVTVQDAFSGNRLTTEYVYAHGVWDGARREFRGFARVDQRDTVTYDSDGMAPSWWSAPTETRTWFASGPFGPGAGAWSELDLSDEWWAEDPPLLGPPTTVALPPGRPRRVGRVAAQALAGRVLRTELYALDSDRRDRPYTVTETTWEVTGVLDGRRADDPDWRAHPVLFATTTGQRTTSWERGTDPMTRASFVAGHDGYGRPRWTLQIAVPRGRDPRQAGQAPGDPYLATLTETTWATRDDEAHYLADRVARRARWELENDGSATVAALRTSALDGSLPRRIRELELTYYDGAPFEGLPAGQLGETGLAVRTERLAFTDELLTEAYGPPSTWPPYLAAPPPDWPAEYPEGFRASVPAAGAGYLRQDADDHHVAGWYVQLRRVRYDTHADPAAGRGLVVAARDELGHDTAISYDDLQLLPTRVVDPTGLVSGAEYDRRLLRPSLVTDPNGNRKAAGWTPLGLLAWVASLGRPGREEGDTPEQPGVRYTYGLTAWDDSPAGARQPAWVASVRRVEHRWQVVQAERDRRAAGGLPPPTDAEVAALFPDDELERHPERFLRTREFTDGFGRSLQTRTWADTAAVVDLGLPVDLDVAPGDAVLREHDDPAEPIVVVGGWVAYDNKGRVVQAWEPFFDTGWDYQPPSIEQLQRELAQTTSLYDPLGRLVRTVHPDGSEHRVVRGIPADPTDPGLYIPTPWISYDYDANDNSGRTHPQQSQAWAAHWDTPASAVVDALGRVVENARRTRTEVHLIRNVYDIDGRLLEVVDPRGLRAVQTVPDLLGRVLRQELADAGTVRLVRDAAGNVVEQRDGKDALVVTAYDAANRPIRRWAADRGGRPATLREVVIYGDDESGSGLTRDQAAAANLLGRPHLGYDEAGLVTSHRYDLSGNVVELTRRVLRVDRLLSGLPQPGGNWAGTAYPVDWEPPPGVSLTSHAEDLLDDTIYEVSSRFDAAGRRTTLTAPRDVDGRRRVLAASYGRSGNLSQLTVDGDLCLKRIAYNARGQRVLEVRGNDVITRYAYDPRNFRMLRLRTEAAQEVEPLRWRGRAGVGPLQDQRHFYDLIGNLVGQRLRVPDGGVPGGDPDRLDREFGYDALYRLETATGRECDLPAAAAWLAQPGCVDRTRTRAYTQSYRYDAAGNLTRLTHRAGGAGWTRELTPAADGNRLASVTLGADPVEVRSDGCGNLIRETTSRHFEWDHANRLATFRTQAQGADASQYAQYRYDPAGQRVVKVVRDQGGGLMVTVYVEGLFERLVHTTLTETSIRDELHVMDGVRRVAIIRSGPPLPDDPMPEVTWHVADHLGSSALVLGTPGDLINREEFTPYGETSFGGYGRKRYRFTGKERDEESGLAYHGARYYAPWQCRWVSCDPIGPADGLNLYAYAGGNPTGHVDRDGRQAEDWAAAAAPAVTQAGRVLTALERASLAWRVEAAVVSGGAAVEGGAAATGTALATGGAVTVGAVVVGVTALVAGAGLLGYQLYRLHQANTELAEAQARAADTQRRLDEHIDQMFKNGQITYEQLLLYRNTGNIPGITGPGADQGGGAGDAPAAAAEAAPAAAADPAPGTKSGGSGKPKKRKHNQSARRKMERIINKAPGHLLKPLVNPATGRFFSGQLGSELPSVQMGHGFSLHASGGEERLLLEDTELNQITSNTGESKGVVFEKTGVDLQGVPVELRTARLLEKTLEWPAGTVDNAPRTDGWVYPAKTGCVYP